MLVIKSCKKECLKAAVTSSHELVVLIKFIRYSVSLGASSVVRYLPSIEFQSIPTDDLSYFFFLLQMLSNCLQDIFYVL